MASEPCSFSGENLQISMFSNMIRVSFFFVADKVFFFFTVIYKKLTVF